MGAAGEAENTQKIQRLACDEALKRHILQTVLCVAADGDGHGRRILFLAAREVFPNLLIVIRDSAHAIRIASQALHTDGVFGEVWDELFDARHALVPDLMNSKKWHGLLAVSYTHLTLPTKRIV